MHVYIISDTHILLKKKKKKFTRILNSQNERGVALHLIAVKVNGKQFAKVPQYHSVHHLLYSHSYTLNSLDSCYHFTIRNLMYFNHSILLYIYDQ